MSPPGCGCKSWVEVAGFLRRFSYVEKGRFSPLDTGIQDLLFVLQEEVRVLGIVSLTTLQGACMRLSSQALLNFPHWNAQELRPIDLGIVLLASWACSSCDLALMDSQEFTFPGPGELNILTLGVWVGS